MVEPRHGRRCARWICLGAVLLWALPACRTAPPLPPPPPPAPAQPPTDSSYDWHGLLIAPFGSVLKEVPATLHEVLLFHDQARSATADEEAECYGTDTTAPRFVGQTPEEYVLCFKRDRLARVQATVRLAAPDAPQVFAAACAGWLKNAAPAADKPDAPAGDATPNGAASDAPACEGRDGAIRFSGRLQAPGSAEAPAEDIALIMTLDSVP
jgi:hypothetical protein